MIRTQVPTVLTLFDVDMSVREARGKVKDMFRQNAHIEDPRTAAILVHKGKAERAAAELGLAYEYRFAGYGRLAPWVTHAVTEAV